MQTMKFKIWLNEIVTPQKPSSKIRKSTVIKNQGTNIAKPILQYGWKTSYGNSVKLQFDQKGPDSFDVVFYVNDTHYDDETASDGRIRDPEVLNSVLHVIKKKADDLGMKEITFKAQSSPKDTRTIFNLPLEPIKSEILKTLSDLFQFILKREPKLIQPTQAQLDLAIKFKRPTPVAKPDIDPAWLSIIQNTIQQINTNQKISAYYDFLKESDSLYSGFKNIGYNIIPLIEQMKRYNEIIESRSPDGWQRKRNRRAEVYDKLMNKFFNDWQIKRSGDYFTLTR